MAWCSRSRDRKVGWGAALFVAAFAAVETARSGDGTDGLRIRELDDQAHASGCGCSFWRKDASLPKNRRLILEWELGEPAWVNVLGHDTALRQQRDDDMCWPEKVGDPCRQVFLGDNLEVVVDVAATWVCPDDDRDESCEVAHFQGRMTVRSGEEGDQVEVEGSCGC